LIAFASNSETWPRVSLITLRCTKGLPSLILSFCRNDEREVLTSTSSGTAKLLAVAEDIGVHGGKPPSPHVLVETSAPGDVLFCAVDELDDITCASAPVTASDVGARLEKGDVVTQLLRFVGRGEARDASTEDDDLPAFACAGGSSNDLGRCGLHGKQPEGLHGCKCCRISARLSYPGKKVPPCDRHPRVISKER
jgi:hypothetical protein